MTYISYIKNIFNWKTKIDRKTFLIRFSILQLPPLLLGILGLIDFFNYLGFFVLIPGILVSIMGLLILYMSLCVIYQHIRMISPKKTLITYFSWLVLFQLIRRCLSFVIIGITTNFVEIANGLAGLSGVVLFILISALLLPIIHILIAWLLTTKRAIRLIQRIVKLLIIFWKRVSSFFS